MIHRKARPSANDSPYFLVPGLIVLIITLIGAVMTSMVAALDYRRTVLGALHEVDDALAAYGADQARRALLEQTVARDCDAVDLARQRYASGMASFIDVLDAERTLEQNELLTADSQTAVSTDLVVLYKALGGGWG